MRPTVRWLLGLGRLRLRSLVDAYVDRPIRWVHISELEDPARFLSGGELLLTTGKGMADVEWDAYVRCLVERDVVGLGFGIGVAHTHVPPPLIEAASRRGLPLLSVPEETPFIAISEAIAEEIARLQERALNSALEAQSDLIRAALSARGPRAVLVELAEALDSWVLLLDTEARIRYAVPTAARRRAARIRMDLDSLGLDVRTGAASLSVGGDQAAVLPIDVRGRVQGYVVAGRTTPLTPVERSVLTGAMGLLSLDLVSEQEANEAERRDRRAVLQLVLGGHAALAEEAADTLAVTLPPGPARIAVLGCSREALGDLLAAAEEQHGLMQSGALVAQYDRRSVLILLSVAEGDLQALEEVLHRVPGARGVASEGVQLADVPDALRRARSVYFGTSKTERLLLARDVATAGLLAQLDNPGAQGWAAALLEPLDRHAQRSKLDLISTLRVFLANNGLVDVSATELGIHRHTLRYRLRRITELLDCSLDDPTARAELWLALRMRELS